MKRHLLSLLALGALFITAVHAANPPKAGTPAPAAATPAPKPMKTIRIATLNGVKANQEFQANLQLIQGQRQLVLQLNDALEKEKDAKKKKELQTQIDTVMTKLNENNAAMQKAYGFSLMRNYTMDIEVSHINLLVTEEEAAKIEQEQKASEKKAQDEKTKKKKK